MKDFSALEKKINIEFNNKDLLTQAFCHRSYLNENSGFHLQHNERLEFLGDAVLELVVTEDLFKNYPGKTEGELTNWRAALVNAKTIFDAASELGLNDFLLLSKGEEKENGKARQYILSDTFEALIGAIYLDRGYDISFIFIKETIISRLPSIIESGIYKDPKSKFQELSQEKESITPSYKTLKESGPDHAKSFIVGVFLNEKMIAQGTGFSKQEAEEEAAKEALKNKNWT